MLKDRKKEELPKSYGKVRGCSSSAHRSNHVVAYGTDIARVPEVDEAPPLIIYNNDVLDPVVDGILADLTGDNIPIVSSVYVDVARNAYLTEYSWGLELDSTNRAIREGIVFATQQFEDRDIWTTLALESPIRAECQIIIPVRYCGCHRQDNRPAGNNYQFKEQADITLRFENAPRSRLGDLIETKRDWLRPGLKRLDLLVRKGTQCISGNHVILLVPHGRFGGVVDDRT